MDKGQLIGPLVLDDGTMISIEDQDRRMWVKPEIVEGISCVKRALRRGVIGPYQVKAAIQAVHAEAESFEGTRWTEILGLYNKLLEFEPTAVTRLNRCVALSFVEGGDVALSESDALADTLSTYQPFHAARAAFFRQVHKFDDADKAYTKAIELSENRSAALFLDAKRRSAKKEAEQLLGL